MRESETPARGPLPTREHRNHSIVGSKMIASGFDIRFERFARVIGKRFVLHEGAHAFPQRLRFLPGDSVGGGSVHPALKALAIAAVVRQQAREPRLRFLPGASIYGHVFIDAAHARSPTARRNVPKACDMYFSTIFTEMPHISAISG